MLRCDTFLKLQCETSLLLRCDLLLVPDCLWRCYGRQVAEAVEGVRPVYSPVDLSGEGAELLRLASCHVWCSTLLRVQAGTQVALVRRGSEAADRRQTPHWRQLTEQPGVARVYLRPGPG